MPIGIGLVTTLRNRIANRTLAALLLVLAGIATPWMIGFAGFYDRWQGLSFVPFSLPLAVPPLLWLFAQALTRGRWPPRGAWHLAPALVQAAAKVAQVWTGYLPALATAFDLALLTWCLARPALRDVALVQWCGTVLDGDEALDSMQGHGSAARSSRCWR